MLYNTDDILETIHMITDEHLDVRTITMGISLFDCISEDINICCNKIYDKICQKAKNLVQTGNEIEKEYGIPIIHKRISVTPISVIAAACKAKDLTPFALTLQKAADECGVNFIGGFSALVQKGFTESDRALIQSIPSALAQTQNVCSSVNVASTRAGINMDAVRDMGLIVKQLAQVTKDQGSIGCA